MAKDNLFTGQPVFTQLLKLIPRDLIEQISQKHHGDHYCKSFFAFDHLVTMMYAGYFQCTSIREVITGLQANAGRLNHLGLEEALPEVHFLTRISVVLKLFSERFITSCTKSTLVYRTAGLRTRRISSSLLILRR